MDPSDARQLVVLFILLVFSALFSSAETALTTVNKIKIKSLADDKVKGAATVYKLIDNPNKMLSAILIGNNIVNLYASSLVTTLATKLFGSSAVGIATGILTILILIFGEITPKTLATMYSEKMSFIYAPFINMLTIILTPVIFIINKMSEGLMFILHIDPSKKHSQMTESELRTIVDVSHQDGVIESEEKKMITNVFDLGDSLAKDIMVPRIDMAFASVDMTYDELISAFKSEQYSRLPVYSENRDNIVGIIYLKDLFLFYDEKDKFDIHNFLRAPYFTYEYKKTSELLNEMRKESVAMVIVLDEYGATSGLITLEDLLEEIVGEIRDEYDEDEVDVIRKVGDNEYIALGSAKLDDINEALGLNLESDDYDSIAGHIINLLDHLPSKGECITDNHVTYEVAAVKKNRIDEVRIIVEPDSPTDEQEEAI